MNKPLTASELARVANAAPPSTPISLRLSRCPPGAPLIAITKASFGFTPEPFLTLESDPSLNVGYAPEPPAPASTDPVAPIGYDENQPL